MKTKLCKCGVQELHPVRIKYGYDTCVSCSTAEKYGCVDIINHKTGNNIQILSRQDADTIAKLTRRRGYGTYLRQRRIGAGWKQSLYGRESWKVKRINNRRKSKCFNTVVRSHPRPLKTRIVLVTCCNYREKLKTLLALAHTLQGMGFSWYE